MNLHKPILYILLSIFIVACKKTASPPEIVPVQTPDTTNVVVADEDTKELASQDRTVWQKPYAVIGLMGDISNKIVADLGAGSGYFAFRLVHKAKKVIAIDIDTNLLRLMEMEKQYYSKAIQDKFETRKTTIYDSGLKQDEVDIVFISNTYPYIENRTEYMRKLKPKIKKGGSVIIVDFKKKATPFGPSAKFKVAQDVVELELQSAGYTIQKSDDTTLDYQYIIVASPSI